MAGGVSPVPEGRHTVSPYLIVENAPRILTFIEQAFGGTVLEDHRSPAGDVVHAEVRVGDSVVMLSEASGEWTGFRAMIHLYMDDVDAVFRRAVEAGGRPVREPETMEYGDRSGGVEDPAANQWWIATRVAERDGPGRG